jgi:HlyD family secretion protein
MASHENIEHPLSVKRRVKLQWLLLLIGIVVLVALVRFVGGVFTPRTNAPYRMAAIKRGDIRKTIACSGPIDPVTRVDVGTQVSGTIARIYVDYNDQVSKDQILAELDTSLFKAEVDNAEANLLNKEAALEEAQAEYDRNLPIFNKGVISDFQFITTRVKLKSRKAELQSARASLQKARRNHEYAVIRSPIDGIVIAKNVEEGQTVAANFETPTLFEIAADLSHLEILVNVDESDIGDIREGQKVTFEVQAYDGRVFEGTVKKIRLQPKLISNVVNYTVVVDAVNQEHLLLPGMTAEVDFIIAEKKNALLAPAAALQFQPPGAPAGESGSREAGEDQGRLWFIDRNGRLAKEQVKTGIADGSFTELIDAGALTEGMQVLCGVSSTEKVGKSIKNVNRLLMGDQAGPPPGPPPPGL